MINLKGKVYLETFCRNSWNIVAVIRVKLEHLLERSGTAGTLINRRLNV